MRLFFPIHALPFTKSVCMRLRGEMQCVWSVCLSLLMRGKLDSTRRWDAKGQLKGCFPEEMMYLEEASMTVCFFRQARILYRLCYSVSKSF